MKILFIGDIFGRAGMYTAQVAIPNIKQTLKPDLIIANAENASSGGKGLTREDYRRLTAAGVDYITLGNHAWDKPELRDLIKEVNNIVRPANYIEKYPGPGHIIFKHKGKKILLANLLGKVYMNYNLVSPLKDADRILDNNDYDIAIFDFHAEATAEKIIFANYVSDRAQMVMGTHTHVPTADERIINGKTAFVTDVGMTGVYDSSIGLDFEGPTARALGKKGVPFKEAEGETELNSILVEFYENTNKPHSIQRVRIKNG